MRSLKIESLYDLKESQEEKLFLLLKNELVKKYFNFKGRDRETQLTSLHSWQFLIKILRSQISRKSSVAKNIPTKQWFSLFSFHLRFMIILLNTLQRIYQGSMTHHAYIYRRRIPHWTEDGFAQLNPVYKISYQSFWGGICYQTSTSHTTVFSYEFYQFALNKILASSSV